MKKIKSKKSEFDNYAKKYKNFLDISLPNFLNEPDYFARYKVDLVHNYRQNKKTKSILDFGCGIGLSLKFFSKYYPHSKLWGYDTSAISLKYAKNDLNGIRFKTSMKSIPKNYFDIVFVANVFHHMKIKDQKKAILSFKNFLNRNGYIYFFEHNPLNPLTRIIFNNSPLDKNAEMIPLKKIVKLAQMAGMKVVRKKYTLFFPKQLFFLRFIEKFIGWIPIGAQYMIILKK